MCNHNSSICLKCMYLITDANKCLMKDEDRFYCGILVPKTYYKELKETYHCEYFKENKDKVQNILIMGASGLIGSNLYRTFSSYRCFNVKGTCNFNNRFDSLDYFELSNYAETIDYIHKNNPDILFWCINSCLDREKDKIYKTLSYITENLNRNIKFIYFSHADIFNGEKGNYSEDDFSNELLHDNTENKYIKNEINICNLISTLDNHLIIRTSNVYGKYGDFKYNDGTTDYLFHDLSIGRKLFFPDNIYQDHTNAAYLSASVLKILNRKNRETFNISSQKRSIYSHYKLISEFYGYDPALIKKETGDLTKRKKDISLNNDKFLEFNEKYINS